MPHLESLRAQFGGLPATLVADAGYGSEGNYEWLRAEGVEAFVRWARAYADQTEADHALLVEAVRAGRLPSEPGV